MRWNSWFWMIVSLSLCISCNEEKVYIENYNCEALIDWNHLLIDYALEEDGLLTLKGVRTAAMTHIAMHNALNTIVPVFNTYHSNNTVVHADPIAAIAQAAYQVVVSHFPAKEDELKEKLDYWLNAIPDGMSKEEGIRLGSQNALDIIAERKQDNWNTESQYEWHPMAPGVYAEFNEHSGTPEGFIFGAGWAEASPFLLESSNQFRSPPPPTIDSPSYTLAFEEVKTYGIVNSIVRSQDQEHLAMWWKDFVENSHNRLARQLVVKEELNLWEGARLFALLNMTIYDAYVNVFDNKFHYNHWRPYTAIR